MRKLVLVGNPNCGKSTLFNALTGSNQRIGNWPGVTVEKKSGLITPETELIDLPGLYALTDFNDLGMDERISLEFILNQEIDLILNIVDANHLERHLYLTTQLREMGTPLILVVNMIDLAQKKGLSINLKQLAKQFNCPVIGINAHHEPDVLQLKKLIAQHANNKPFVLTYPETIEQHLNPLNRFTTLQTLETSNHDDVDIQIANTRYEFVQTLIQSALNKQPERAALTSKLDNLFLNRFLGLPLFFAMMYLLFFITINIGGAFQTFFNLTSQALFVEGTEHLLSVIHSPDWLIALLANGVGKGLTTTLTFVPVIACLYFVLAFLESSGYMARGAFVVDKLMQTLGLPGKAFVPLIVGFGCNVPSVMAARTLGNHRERILTIMMSPFMSCGARLAIYAIFVSAFFPNFGAGIVFSLYLIGISMAVLTGLLLKHTFLKGEPSSLLMELPEYQLPRFKTLFSLAWRRLKGFIWRAGKLIVPISLCIGFLTSINVHGQLTDESTSILAWVGKTLTPLFSPMGIHEDNWPATVGLLTGILAKEVVVGTLNTLYAHVNHIHLALNNDSSILNLLHDAILSIPQNLQHLWQALINPIAAQAPIETLPSSVYGAMQQHFDGQTGAFAYLLFVLLYFPCVSTMGAILKELNVKWMLFSTVWTTGIAYLVAVGFYQLTHHPIAMSTYLPIIVVSLTLVIFYLWSKRRKNEFARP